jgi:hypothetical protein
MDHGMARANPLRCLILVALAVGAAIAAHDSAPAEAASLAYTCVNPASRTAWPMLVDDRRATVDANPAKITNAEISWFDPRDGSYNIFNRTTGELTASIASSTGGYFRYAHCRLDTAR